MGSTRLTVVVLLAAALLAGACTDTATQSIRVVSVDEAATIVAAGGVTIVDVRTPEEFADGHLEDALLMDLQAEDFEERVAELDRSGRYLVYCRTGNRSAQARQIMEELGFLDVADMAGGISAWVAAGRPVSTG